MLELTSAQIKIVFDNMFRKCPECKTLMQPLSTMCSFCRQQQPPKTTIVEFQKVVPGSFYEHFEIKKCEIHDTSTVWFCVHPASDSILEDLRQACTQCLRDQQNQDLR